MKSIDGILKGKQTPVEADGAVWITQKMHNVATDVFTDRSVQIVRNQELLSHRLFQMEAESDMKFNRVDHQMKKQSKVVTLTMQLIVATLIGFFIAAMGIL